MRQVLSSKQTFVMKYLFPGFWLAGFTAATISLFSDVSTGAPTQAPPPPEMKWLFLAVTVLGGAFLYWTCMRLKRVEMDHDVLYVSNYRREVRVPLRDIAEVSENRWINIRPVTIEFRRDTDFGHRVVFIPQQRLWAFWRPHPVVAELQGAVRRARGLPPEWPAA